MEETKKFKFNLDKRKEHQDNVHKKEEYISDCGIQGSSELVRTRMKTWDMGGGN